MFGSEIEDNFEFRIHWQKSYIIYMKCQNVCTSRSKRSGDTFYTGSCTNVNADGVPELQHYQDTYISHCTKFGCKKAIYNYTYQHLKSFITYA